MRSEKGLSAVFGLVASLTFAQCGDHSAICFSAAGCPSNSGPGAPFCYAEVTTLPVYTACPASAPDCVKTRIPDEHVGTTVVGRCQASLRLHPAPPCVADADCPASQSICVFDGLAAGGFCSRSCLLATDACAADSCVPTVPGDAAICRPTCGNGQACPAGYACLHASIDEPALVVSTDGFQGDDAWCVPHCTSDADCRDVPCDEYTGLCRTTKTSLQEDGAACTGDADCRSGACVPPTVAQPLSRGQVSTNETGYLDGMCFSRCAQPDEGAYAGPTLPRADCPAGSVCARAPGFASGDLSVCFAHCNADADCRPDYVCVHPVRAGSTERTEDGFCDARVNAYSKT